MEDEKRMLIGKCRIVEIWAALEYVDTHIEKWSVKFPGSPSYYDVAKYVIHALESTHYVHIKRHLENLVAEQAVFDAVNFEKLRG